MSEKVSWAIPLPPAPIPKYIIDQAASIGLHILQKEGEVVYSLLDPSLHVIPWSILRLKAGSLVTIQDGATARLVYRVDHASIAWGLLHADAGTEVHLLRQQKAFLKGWLDARLRSPYGRAVLGGLMASPVGIPLLAQVFGRGEALADRMADEFAARAMTEGGVQLTKDAVRFVPKGAFKLVEKLFTKFAEVEKGRPSLEPAPPNLSQLPSADPRHVCGMFCDGQDGSNSDCARAKRAASLES